jgi:hypothetical protein
LALACGTYQAHISLIESNRVHPQLSTLTMICDVLHLKQSERSSLLALAGYSPLPPLPDEQEVNRIVSQMRPILEGYPYPAQVFDESDRVWYWNSTAAALFGPLYGASDKQSLEELTHGKRFVELVFDAEYCGPWQGIYEDLDQMRLKMTCSFLRLSRVRPHDEDIKRTWRRLWQNPDFPKYVARLEEEPTKLLSLCHALYGIRHPQFGHLRFHAFRTPLAIDERFFITHFVAANSVTSRVFGRLANSGQYWAS